MPSRIVVYKFILVAWLILSGTLGYLLIAKSERLLEASKSERGSLLDRIIDGHLLGGGVSINKEGFDRCLSSIVERSR